MSVLRGGSWRAAALLFAVDGVLLDTAVAHRATWRWWATRCGADPDEVAAAAIGRAVPDVVQRYAAGRERTTEVALVEERLRTVVPGARRIAGAAGLVRSVPPGRAAVVSSAPRVRTELELRRARTTAPPVVVTLEDAERGRPEPDAHLAAIAALGRTPGRCLALESTAVGVAAARAAGCRVVLVGAPGRAPVPDGADGTITHLRSARVRLVDGGLELTARRDPPVPR